MKKFTTAAAALALLAAASACAATSTTAGTELKTARVTLYDCGLAQLEKQAAIDGASTLEITVEHAHVDDLLASLVLATDGTVRVRGVTFPGVRNLGQSAASSGFAASMIDEGSGLEIPSDLAGYARALVGTKVVVTEKGGDTLEGTVLDAILPPGQDGGEEEEGASAGGEPLMVIVTPEGALRWIPLSGMKEVAPASKLEASAIRSFSAALGKATGFTETSLVMETTPDSKGMLAASYIRQSPIWRMLYKVAVNGGGASLEAWAVVHNDTPEDWQDVSMTLVSGLPTSYVLSVASPRYVHREVLETPGEWDAMVPQLGAQTPDSLLYDWDIYHEGSLGYGGFGAAGYGYGSGGGSAMGSLSGRSVAGSGGYGEMSSSLLEVGESAAEETMEAEVEQEISTYTSMTAVSLPSGAASLVPLIRRELPGDTFTQLVESGDASTCLRTENTTGLVLQPGMTSFYVDGRFRGQGELDRVEPGEIRVLCFGLDPDVTYWSHVEEKNVHTALEWKDDALWLHTLRTTTIDYTIENKAGQERRLAVPITHIKNGRIVSPPEAVSTDSDTRWLHLFRVAPRSEGEKTTVVEEGVMATVPLIVSRLDKLLDSPDLPEKYKKALASARPHLLEKEKLEETIAAKRELIAKHEESITFKKDLLAAVPETAAKSKTADKILAEIIQAKKQATALEDDIKEIDEKIAGLLEKAESELEKMLEPG